MLFRRLPASRTSTATADQLEKEHHREHGHCLLLRVQIWRLVWRTIRSSARGESSSLWARLCQANAVSLQRTRRTTQSASEEPQEREPEKLGAQLYLLLKQFVQRLPATNCFLATSPEANFHLCRF